MKTLRHWLIARRRKALLAFNLIEVTLSVAIIGVAVAVLLGMFPVGLKAGRDAANYTMASAIANSVLSTLQAGGGGGTFSRINFYQYGTLVGGGSIVYWQSGTGSMMPVGTFIFNAANPSLTINGTRQPFIIFFDAEGRSTSNRGTGSLNLPNALGTATFARRPYYRVEFTITNNSSLVSGTNVATVIMNVRWPCISDASSATGTGVAAGTPLTGWRPRRGGLVGTVTASDVFTDKTATYFGIIIQNNK